MFPSNLAAAAAYASRHFATSRKSVAHSHRVVGVLRDEFLVDDDDVLTAGLLHDVLEDTNATADEISHLFSPRAAALVRELSHPPHPTAAEYAAYEARLASLSADARTIKLADILDNIRETRRGLECAKHGIAPRFTPNQTKHWIARLRGILASWTKEQETPEINRVVAALDDLQDLLANHSTARRGRQSIPPGTSIQP